MTKDAELAREPDADLHHRVGPMKPRLSDAYVRRLVELGRLDLLSLYRQIYWCSERQVRLAVVGRPELVPDNWWW